MSTIFFSGTLRDFIARTHGCEQKDSETHETVLSDCTTGEAANAIL